jgi:hypothetical protein
MVLNYSEEVKHAMQLHYRQLREKDRRRYAAVEALKLGYGGTSYISRLLCVDRKTILEGKKELQVLTPPAQMEGRQRRAGGGRKKKDGKTS